MSNRKSRPRVDWQAITLALVERGQGGCDACGRPLPNEGVARHHRKLRSQGGDDSLGNLMLLHTACHVWAHANPRAAMDLGWIVSGWGDPDTVPIIQQRI